MNYFANSAGSIPGALFAKTLIAKMPGMSRVYYSNSGSEANEKAFKMIRQISHKAPRRQEIQDPLPRARLSRHHIWRRCLPADSRSGRAIRPLAPGFVMVPHCLEYRNQYPDAEATACRRRRDRGGDPARGSGHGRRPLPRADHRRRRRHHPAPRATGTASRRSAAKYDILLHIDEVVCGVGRTGHGSATSITASSRTS
jgi:taurine-pyruvate aminotransferase